jgi:FKBP-type peptidyl-prolyl cis-trans isomerase FkpA
MRKSILICSLLSVVFLSSCVKDQCGYVDKQIVANDTEIAYMQNYFTTNNITNLTQHPSGVFYTITNPGTGASPNLCSSILVNYEAYRFGYASSFNSYTDPAGIGFVLGSLITGVQKVTPLLKAGGQITMYIPPSLAYGFEPQSDQNGTVILPANSYIKFVMSLIDVAN